MSEWNLEEYLSHGVDRIIKGILKASLQNPKESIFMMQYAKDSRRAREIRRTQEEEGTHIPPFLIASITNQCNLHCKGCYARANHSCHDRGTCENGSLRAEEWKRIFDEAAELGIGFVLLAGGEPTIRPEVLEAAGKQKKILFPVFTNGTLMKDSIFMIFEKNRNLIPVFSIEGDEQTTDTRRGAGTYQMLVHHMERCKKEGILYAASVTVHKDNMEEALSDSFLHKLSDKGCKGVVYVEYVPVDGNTRNLALEDADRDRMNQRLDQIRTEREDMVFVSFPGDEKSSGGCLAAGRGFFHINAAGGAEPCPFSPYSDTSLKTMSLKEALNSPLFVRLREEGHLERDHIGGCVLFEQEEEVRRLLGGV
ncbi:MAG: radical SAM protein [Dorea sp.]|nr:radical SAM protein [Dorea sp.]